jgi:hypothetical protein
MGAGAEADVIETGGCSRTNTPRNRWIEGSGQAIEVVSSSTVRMGWHGSPKLSTLFGSRPSCFNAPLLASLVNQSENDTTSTFEIAIL